jgi:hypothetical protein
VATQLLLHLQQLLLVTQTMVLVARLVALLLLLLRLLLLLLLGAMLVPAAVAVAVHHCTQSVGHLLRLCHLLLRCHLSFIQLTLVSNSFIY